MANTVLYTKTGADKAIASAIAPLATRADLAGLATKDEVAKAAVGGKIDLNEYAKKTDLAGLATKAELAGYAPASQVADLPTRADLAGLATKADVAGVARASDLAVLATKSELAGYATKDDIAGVAHTSDLAGLATKVELTEALKRVGITVCSTEAEAKALPDGAIYFLVAGATPTPTPQPVPAPATGPVLVGHAAGQVVGQTVTVTVDGKAGDRIVIGLNAKVSAAETANVTLPQGWEQIVAPYWVGTMRFTIIAGPWTPTINITLSQNAEIGWAAAVIRGGIHHRGRYREKATGRSDGDNDMHGPSACGRGPRLGVGVRAYKRGGNRRAGECLSRLGEDRLRRPGGGELSDGSHCEADRVRAAGPRRHLPERAGIERHGGPGDRPCLRPLSSTSVAAPAEISTGQSTSVAAPAETSRLRCGVRRRR